MTSKSLLAILVVFVLVAPAAFADPQPLLTMNWWNLDGDFDLDAGGTTGTFTGRATDTLGTGGIVQRWLDPTGSAMFSPGFLSSSSADYVMELSLSNITSTSADATGALTVTDADGDTITADISGSWTDLQSAAGFTGNLSNVWITDNGTTDGLFNGAGAAGDNGTSFELDFGTAVMPLFGALVDLTFLGNDVFFDDGDFENAWTSGNVTVIPAPGAALLGLLGLGVVDAVRRRFGRG